MTNTLQNNGQNIRQYLIKRANEDKALGEK